jgi:hypothetical protein
MGENLAVVPRDSFVWMTPGAHGHDGETELEVICILALTKTET